MMDAFFNALSGLRVSSRKLENSANNVANVTTPGFKKSRVDAIEQSTGGTRVSGVTTSNQPGAVLTTSNPIDLAVSGNGFFQVGLPGGGTGFTRAGQFKIDSQGRLADSQGNPLQPEIQVPGGATQLSVGGNGEVTALVGGESVNLGQIELANFNNPGGLTSAGNNLRLESASSGQPVTGQPGQGGLGAIVSGGLETSNVDITEETVDQLLARQAFQANINVIKIADEMTGSLLDITS